MSNGGITPEDVAKLMVSVSEMEFTLYPKSYKTDAKIAKILGLKPLDCFIMYRSEFFACIDKHYGNITKWFGLFKKRFGDSLSIDEHYDELVANFSSAEIVSYYNIYPNLSYYSFNVMDCEDDRGSRTMHGTVMRIPDTSIKSCYVNLRSLYPQDTTNLLNKFFIKRGAIEDNAMFKKPAVTSVSVSAMFDLLSEFVSETKDEKLAAQLYSEISFLDLDELADVRVTLLTDYPKL